MQWTGQAAACENPLWAEPALPSACNSLLSIHMLHCFVGGVASDSPIPIQCCLTRVDSKQLHAYHHYGMCDTRHSVFNMLYTK